MAAARSSDGDVDLAGAYPNAHRLLWAGFMAILAAGVGFAIRGGILDNWREQFQLHGPQVGQITAAPASRGFCFGIIIGGVIVDKIGYGKLVALALLGHILSALVTFSAASADTAYQLLFWGLFIFAFANGTLEAVANPLVATVFPKNRTHYLNILHASWPAGLVLGTVAGWYLDDKLQIALEVSVGPLPGADGDLRADVSRPDVSPLRSGREWGELRRHVSRRGHPGRRRGLFSAGPVLRRHPQKLHPRASRGRRVCDRRRPALGSRRDDEVFDRVTAAVHPVRHACPGRRGGVGHG